MVEVPVGDVLRTVVKKGWLRKLLDLLKGIRITKGGTTIVLSERSTLGGTKSDLEQPHKPGPIR